MRNPFSHHQPADREAERSSLGIGGLGKIGGPGWTGWGHAGPEKLRELNGEQGWGTIVSRIVQTPGGEPCGLQFSLPDADDFFELGQLAQAPASSREATVYVGSERTDLAAAAQQPGVVLVGAVCPRDDQSEVLMTVAVRLATSVAPLAITADPAAGVDVIDCSPFNSSHNGHMDSATLVFDLHTPRARAFSVYQVTRDTPGGLVSITFSSGHDGSAGMWGREYTVAIGWSLWCGPTDELPSGGDAPQL
jgi:hypothetical protein